MVESLLDEGADINIQDEIDVILHTDAVDYFQSSGRCCTYWLLSLLFQNKILSFQAL